eukprot:251111_1
MTAKKLRDLALLLTNNTSQDTIHQIKSQLLVLADDLDAAKTLNTHDIDTIFNEIDEIDTKKDDIDLNTDSLKDTVRSLLQWLTEKWKHTLDENKWKLLFTDKCLNKQYKQNNLTEKHSLNAWNQIPQAIRNDIAWHDSWVKTWDANDKVKENQNNNFNKLVQFIIQNAENNIVYKIIVSHARWLQFYHLVNQEFDTLVKFYSQYKHEINVNYIHPYRGKTLLHELASSYDSTSQAETKLKWLISIGVDVNICDYDGEVVLDQLPLKAKNIVLFASMSNKMRDKAENQIAKLKRTEGIIKQWFRFYNVNDKKSNEYKSMKKMVESIKELIHKKLPISDDLLLLCFQFEMIQNKGDTLKCSIWKCLYNM